MQKYDGDNDDDSVNNGELVKYRLLQVLVHVLVGKINDGGEDCCGDKFKCDGAGEGDDNSNNEEDADDCTCIFLCKDRNEIIADFLFIIG